MHFHLQLDFDDEDQPASVTWPAITALVDVITAVIVPASNYTYDVTLRQQEQLHTLPVMTDDWLHFVLV